jgi:molybdopterin synthase catalytic subunit
MILLVRDPIDVAAMQDVGTRDGALCLFLGVVRGDNDGRPVLRLEYEAYEDMALPMMEEIGADTLRRFGVSEVRIVHRLGRLEVGEVSVAVAAASPHRAEAFAACRHAIDTLKARVPIWKKEFYADGALVPVAHPAFGLGIVGADQPAVLLVEQRRVGGVVERAQHPGDIAEGRTLLAALTDRPGRLALEVDNDEVAAGIEHLTEVVITVIANPLGLEPGVDDVAEPLVDRALQLDDLLGFGLDGFGHHWHPLAQCLDCLVRQTSHRLVKRALVEHRRRLRREVRLVTGRQCEVQFGGSLAEQVGVVQVMADDLVGLLWHTLFGQVEQDIDRERSGFDLRTARQRAFEEVLDHVECVDPCVAFVGDVALEDAKHDRLVAVAATAGVVFETADDRRDLGELRLIGQVAADLQVGVKARLQLAIQLQDEPVAVRHRRVGLLSAHIGGVERSLVGRRRVVPPGARRRT